MGAEALEQGRRGPVEALADGAAVRDHELLLEVVVADRVVGPEPGGLRGEGEQQRGEHQDRARVERRGRLDQRPRDQRDRPRRRARSGRRRRPGRRRSRARRRASRRPGRRPSRGRGRRRGRSAAAIRARPMTSKWRCSRPVDELARVAALGGACAAAARRAAGAFVRRFGVGFLRVKIISATKRADARSVPGTSTGAGRSPASAVNGGKYPCRRRDFGSTLLLDARERESAGTGARRRGRRGDRRRPAPHPAPGGPRGPLLGRRRRGAARRRGVRPRPGDPRPRAARPRRGRGLPPPAGRVRRADPDPDRPQRPRRPRRGARLGRRRLPGEAVRAPGAARPHARPDAPPPAPRQRRARRRRPAPQPRHPRGHPGRARDRAHQPRVRAARVPDAQRAPRRLARAPARGGLGLRPAGDDEHDRRLHLQPAPQARGGRRAAPAAHQARRRLRPPGGRGAMAEPDGGPSSGPACRSLPQALARPLAPRRRLGRADAADPGRLRARRRAAGHRPGQGRLPPGAARAPPASCAASSSSGLDTQAGRERPQPAADRRRGRAGRRREPATSYANAAGQPMQTAERARPRRPGSRAGSAQVGDFDVVSLPLALARTRSRPATSSTPAAATRSRPP